MNWISVKDKVPDIDKRVLMTNGEYEWVGFIQSFDNGNIAGWVLNPGYYYAPDLSNKIPTHWMPLPEFPK